MNCNEYAASMFDLEIRTSFEKRFYLIHLSHSSPRSRSIHLTVALEPEYRILSAAGVMLCEGFMDDGMSFD